MERVMICRPERSLMPNQNALQRTRPSRPGCNRTPSWAGSLSLSRYLRHEVAIGTAWRSNPDQALRVAADIPRKHAPDGQPRKLSGLLPGVWSLPGNVSNLVASNRERARIGGQVQN